MLKKLFEVLFNFIRSFFSLLFANVHTILLIVGMTLMVVAAFLLSEIIGFFFAGIMMVVLALLINKEVG